MKVFFHLVFFYLRVCDSVLVDFLPRFCLFFICPNPFDALISGGERAPGLISPIIALDILNGSKNAFIHIGFTKPCLLDNGTSNHWTVVTRLDSRGAVGRLRPLLARFLSDKMRNDRNSLFRFSRRELEIAPCRPPVTRVRERQQSPE